MANGRPLGNRYGGSIFTPQDAPYDFGKDVLQAMMREKAWVDERKSQVMEFARQMDPVEFSKNELMLWQNDEINTLTDEIVSIVKDRKALRTFSTDDRLNIQFKMNKFRSEQQHLLGIQNVLEKEMAVYKDPRNSGVYSQPEMANREFNFVTKRMAPEGGTFLVKNPKNFPLFVQNFNPVPKANINKITVGGVMEGDPTKTRSIEKTIWGDFTKGSPYAGTEKDPLWIFPRVQAMANELLLDDALMAGARESFNDPTQVSPEEKAMWEDKALTLRTTESSKDKDAQGRSVTFQNGMPLDGAFYWGVDQAKKSQPTTEIDITKDTPSSLLPKPPKTEAETEAISWAGEPDKIETTISYPSSSGTKDVTYSSEDTATLTEVKLDGGADAARINVAGDYFVIGGNIEGNLIGKSINEEGLKSTLRGNTYQLAAKPRIKKGMRVYMGDDVELEGFITKDRGRKGKLIGGDENLKLFHGMPIDDETWAEIEKEAKGGNEAAQKIIDNSPQKNVAHIEIKTGAYDTAKLLRVYDKDLANELGTEYFEYEGEEEPENENWWEK